jgi:hypothetical protein
LRPGTEDVETFGALKAYGAPVVEVLVSGRPPGTEDDGIADGPFGDHRPTGRFSTMQNTRQQLIDIGDGRESRSTAVIGVHRRDVMADSGDLAHVNRLQLAGQRGGPRHGPAPQHPVSQRGAPLR